MSTEFPSKNGIVRQWHVIDAEDVVLGKLASKAAMLLMGKTKPTITPFLDTGDHVIVINAAKVRLTGRKEDNKVYRHFTGYPGGLVEKSLQARARERPARIVEEAIQGMLPKTKLGKQMYRKLKVYAGDRHPHAAQKPAALAVKIVGNSERFISGSEHSSIFGYGPPQEIGGPGDSCGPARAKSRSTTARSRTISPPKAARAWCGSRWRPPRRRTSSTS